MLIRVAAGHHRQPSAASFDGRTLPTAESGGCAGYDRARSATAVNPVNEQERAGGEPGKSRAGGRGGACHARVYHQAYTGAQAVAEAAAHGITLAVVTLPEANKGFVVLPRRWVVERSLAWMAKFRRLARDYERLPETVAALHFVAFRGSS